MLITKISIRDLLAEAAAGVLQRPGRTALTMLGTVLGVGSFVAVLGLTATASGQISERFDSLVATEVLVEAAEDVDRIDSPFPSDAEARVSRLKGVKGVGVMWELPSSASEDLRPSLQPGVRPVENVPILAASAGFITESRPKEVDGRLYDVGHDHRTDEVTVLGIGAARQLGISTLLGNPAIYINGIPFTVIGVLKDVDRNTELLSSVLVPQGAAERIWGMPADANAMLMRVDTELGAATTIADQVALALRPDAPDAFAVAPPPDPRSLRESVDSDLDALFLVLAGICLLIGAVGIANTTLVAVLERTPEIGLRRALGARPLHIAAQILTEAAAVGSLGGLIGTAIGVLTVVGIAATRDWSALVEPWAVLPAPLIGTMTGFLAGLYPAMRAAKVEPVQALQR